MKKIGWILGGVVIVVAIAALLIFALSGQAPAQEPVELNITGAWKVVSYIANGSVTLFDDQYMVFTETTASVFRTDLVHPAATGSYTLTDGAYPRKTLSVPDLGKIYTVEIVTDNIIRLCESPTAYMDLVRYPNVDLTPTSLTGELLEGRWNVNHRDTTEIITNEYFVFENGSMSNYRNSNPEPVVQAQMQWLSANRLSVPNLRSEYIFLPYSQTMVFLVEVSTGVVWELEKAN